MLVYIQAQYENKISKVASDLENAQSRAKEMESLNQKLKDQSQQHQIDCEKKIWDLDLEGKSLRAQLDSKNRQVQQLEGTVEKCKKEHQEGLGELYTKLDTEAEMLKEQHRQQLSDLETWASDLELEKARTQEECRVQVGRNERYIERLEEEMMRVKEKNLRAEKDVKVALDAVSKIK